MQCNCLKFKIEKLWLIAGGMLHLLLHKLKLKMQIIELNVFLFYQLPSIPSLHAGVLGCGAGLM